MLHFKPGQSQTFYSQKIYVEAFVPAAEEWMNAYCPSQPLLGLQEPIDSLRTDEMNKGTKEIYFCF